MTGGTTVLRLPTLVGGHELVCGACNVPLDVVRDQENPRRAQVTCPQCKVAMVVTVPEPP